MIITAFEWYYYLVIPLSTKLQNNSLLKSFNEFVLFTNVKTLDNWWLKGYNVTSAFVEIKEFPPNLTTGNDGSCWGIKGSLTIPAKMSKLGGNYAFGNRAGSGSVTELIIKRSTPPTVSIMGQFPSTTKIYVPDEAVSTYKSTSPWSSYASRIYPISQYPVG